MGVDTCTNMCMCGHVRSHAHGHVYGHVLGHVHGHVGGQEETARRKRTVEQAKQRAEAEEAARKSSEVVRARCGSVEFSADSCALE